MSISHKTDVLILGGGIAGCVTAIRLSELNPELQITILNKTTKGDTNTSWAQGGIATVWDQSVDKLSKHIEDTLIAGDGLCNEQAVEFVINSGPEGVRQLIQWGVQFDKDSSGTYKLGKEGGHSENRILYYKDSTGQEIQRALIEVVESHPNIKVFEHYFAIDLLTPHHLGYTLTRMSPEFECFGCYALDTETREIHTLLAKKTIIATGGGGQVYKNTTNPLVATGDGIAMVYRAKGRIENMEFVQFHPTALYSIHGENPNFLISEAVRGMGAILRDETERPFMDEYDERGSLAPRDIVARAIDNEMKKQGTDCMFLDCRHLEEKDFIAHFPKIHKKCMDSGINPMKEMIPVTPSCHYICGGIQVDLDGQTSIKNLYACGECSSTGLHGANRLASNSLLEGLVFGNRIAENIIDKLEGIEFRTDIPDWNAKDTTAPKEMVLMTQSLKELKELMSYYVGIVRSDLRLKRAMDRLLLLYQETERLYGKTKVSVQLCELRNLITLGYLISRSAALRKESRGLHYTSDHLNQKSFKESTYL